VDGFSSKLIGARGCDSLRRSARLSPRSNGAPAAHSINQKRGRLRCHKRPKSREETPKVGIGGNNLTAPQQYARAMHKSKWVCPIFFGTRDRILGLCFYFIFEETGRSLGKNGSGSSKTAVAQPCLRIGGLLENRRTAEFQPAGHPESDKANVAPERR
jgi:hypothetical protein